MEVYLKMAKKRDADRILNKPFVKEELLKEVEDFLG